jgi:hypothetical protein
MTQRSFQDKTAIYKRLVRLASELWGLKERNIDAHDPIIGLIFGAVSEELSKIGTEISEIRQGLVDEISTALLPRELNGAKPAHGVLFVEPNEVSIKLNKTNLFSSPTTVTNSSNGRTEERNIFLSPANTHTLNQLTVQRIISPRGLLEWKKSGFEHNEYARVRSNRDSILIGVSMSDQIDFIDNVNLFMYNEHFTNLLQLKEETGLLRARIGNHELEMKSSVSGTSSGINAIKSLVSITLQQEEDVLEFYRPFYYQITCNLNKRNWQEASNLLINKYFDQESAELGLQKYLWIELVSSNSTSSNMLTELRCQTNCVPVINRRYREFSHRMNNFFNIINLPGTDQFYDIENVTSSSGHKYMALNQLQTDGNFAAGTYEVRHHRTGRVDEDEVIAKLNYLIELLRDESSAFSALDLNFLSVHLRTLDQNIEQLRNKIPQSQLLSSNNYLILQTKHDNDTVFVNFWTTEGSLGNRINASSEILPVENYDVNPASVLLVVDMSMGRDRLSPSERLRMLQWQLTSKDGIYSKEDLRRFCLSKSSAIEGVSTKYVMRQMPQSNKGFQKVLNIEIIQTTNQKIDEQEKERLRLEIEKSIENKSLVSFPIMVTWKN